MSTNEKIPESENTVSNTDENKLWQFQPGVSGNPSGKPKGTLHRTTQAAMLLLEGEVEALTRKAVELALEGDTTALRLCLERILSPRKDRPISLALPAIQSIKDATEAMGILTNAVSKGKITPMEGQVMSGTIENYIKSIESAEFEERLLKLEEMATIK